MTNARHAVRTRLPPPQPPAVPFCLFRPFRPCLSPHPKPRNSNLRPTMGAPNSDSARLTIAGIRAVPPHASPVTSYQLPVTRHQSPAIRHSLAPIRLPKSGRLLFHKAFGDSSLRDAGLTRSNQKSSVLRFFKVIQGKKISGLRPTSSVATSRFASCWIFSNAAGSLLSRRPMNRVVEQASSLLVSGRLEACPTAKPVPGSNVHPISEVASFPEPAHSGSWPQCASDFGGRRFP